MPSGENIEDSYERLSKKAAELRDKIRDCENRHCISDFFMIEEMLSNLLQLVNGQRGKDNVTITAYQAGSIEKLTFFHKLKEATPSMENVDINGSTQELQGSIDRYLKKQEEYLENEMKAEENNSYKWQGKTLGEVIKENPDSYYNLHEKGYYLSQQYYYAWYYGTGVFWRMDESMTRHQTYLIYKLDSMCKDGTDLSKLTIEEVNKLCFENESLWFKVDTVALTNYAAYSEYAEIQATPKGVQTSLKSINTGELNILETKTPEIANSEWLERGYDKPPYDVNYEVKVVQAGNEEYVRVFSY